MSTQTEPLDNPADGKTGLFYPPHAQPLRGDEGFIHATWKFLRNPVEGFGP